jgi:hypothetical protein
LAIQTGKIRSSNLKLVRIARKKSVMKQQLVRAVKFASVPWLLRTKSICNTASIKASVLTTGAFYYTVTIPT